MHPDEGLRFRRERLRTALAPLFGSLDDATLSAIESRIVTVPGGAALFRQGDRGDSMFVLISGRLQVHVRDEEGVERMLGEVVAGESVGEMALITGDPRSAGIVAIRDSLLVEIDHTAFESMVAKDSMVLRNLSRALIERLRSRTSGSDRKAHRLSNIAVVPIGGLPSLDPFRRHLEAALERFGSTLVLDEARLEKMLASAGIGGTSQEITSWLDEQENSHRFVLYLSDGRISDWTRRSLRQADLVLLVGDATGTPEITPIEQELLEGERSITGAARRLVLLHPPSTTTPHGTAAWRRRRVDDHLHVREGSDADFARLARFLAGEAVGLVLGGGGARGFAHIGIYRALLEAGIPVDAVAGTSIGSPLAAAIALGWDYERFFREARTAFVVNNPFNDYTVPVVSMLKGRKLERLVREYFSMDIEDTWLPFFCVSSNMSSSDLVIHDHGTLWKALRASVALPGVFPPAVDGNSLLIDGGILNNLPVDVMRTRYRGRVIAVDLHVQKEYELQYDHVPSAWRILRSRYLPFTKRLRVPGIMTIMMKATEIASIVHARSMRASADLYLNPPVGRFGILDTRAFDRLVEIGHQHATEKIAAWKEETGR